MSCAACCCTPRSASTPATPPCPGWSPGLNVRVGRGWSGWLGCYLPGVGRRVYPLCRAYPRLAHDLEAEALAGLVQAIGA